MTATAVRIREGVELPEFAVPENRIVPLVDDPSDEELERDAVAWLWKEARARGEDEPRFRARLRSLGTYADADSLPEYEPAAGLTHEEAALLLREGMAERID